MGLTKKQENQPNHCSFKPLRHIKYTEKRNA
ncbi:hypothetical protein SCB49_08458 [unidentified eubacterium SCB49]|nr:hypothetical protein SCB49_08458 [unidentified eubacterium SCB49]